MNDPLKQTVRISRPGKVTRDAQGRTVSTAPAEEAELELVSSTMLTNMLGSGSEARKRQLQELAASKEGVLAKNLGSGNFEILSDDELKKALAEAGRAQRESARSRLEPVLDRGDRLDTELSLVSSQALRKILGHVEEKPDEDKQTSDGGFDPYNRS
jgi:hypothetical protein